MTEENEPENPAEEVKEHVEDVAEEHPALPEKEEHHETDHVTSHIDAMGEKIISAINSLKEVAPVTEKDIPVPDETPVRKPWTHRWIGK